MRLAKVASKAPRAVVVIPELADEAPQETPLFVGMRIWLLEESPEGWQVLGETPNRQESCQSLLHLLPLRVLCFKGGSLRARAAGKGGKGGRAWPGEPFLDSRREL